LRINDLRNCGSSEATFQNRSQNTSADFLSRSPLSNDAEERLQSEIFSPPRREASPRRLIASD